MLCYIEEIFLRDEGLTNGSYPEEGKCGRSRTLPPNYSLVASSKNSAQGSRKKAQESAARSKTKSLARY